MNTTIGTCSICGGRVTVPTHWSATIPPTPTCESCGAVKAGHGPVIQMTKRADPKDLAEFKDAVVVWPSL